MNEYSLEADGAYGSAGGVANNEALQVCADDDFNSQPATGRVRNDLRVVSGLTDNF